MRLRRCSLLAHICAQDACVLRQQVVCRCLRALHHHLHVHLSRHRSGGCVRKLSQVPAGKPVLLARRSPFCTDIITVPHDPTKPATVPPVRLHCLCRRHLSCLFLTFARALAICCFLLPRHRPIVGSRSSCVLMGYFCLLFSSSWPPVRTHRLSTGRIFAVQLEVQSTVKHRLINMSRIFHMLHVNEFVHRREVSSHKIPFGALEVNSPDTHRPSPLQFMSLLIASYPSMSTYKMGLLFDVLNTSSEGALGMCTLTRSDTAFTHYARLADGKSPWYHVCSRNFYVMSPDEATARCRST